MSKVIRFPARPDKESHFISRRPFCFRTAEWETRVPAMVGLHQAAMFEDHLEKVVRQGGSVSFVPSHLALKGGPGRTVKALYENRENTERIEQVYLLAGMMELATRLSHDLLRTDLIHRLFDTIRTLSQELNLRWSSDREGFLLPLPENLYHRSRLEHRLGAAKTFKELMDLLKAEMQTQLNLAGEHFVYYLPKTWIG